MRKPCPPSLCAVLLAALYHGNALDFRKQFVFSVSRLVSRRCHTIASMTHNALRLRYYEGSDS